MTSKTIFHVGAWNRNYGDYALQTGIHASLRKLSEHCIDFVPVDCQPTMFHSGLVDLINEQADLLLVGGGGLIFNRPEDSSLSGWQFNIGFEQLERLAVPLVIYGIGYNKFPYDESGFRPQMNDHLRAIQQKAALFSVRNKGTYDELVRRGLNPDGLEIIPDPGMFAPAAGGIDLPGIAADDFLIGVNWAGDRPAHRYPEPGEETEAAAAHSLARALDAYLAKRGDGKVLLIPHLSGIDSAIAPIFRQHLGERLYDIESETPYLFPPSYAQTPLLIALYHRVNAVLGMRGHANIIPFGTGTPFAGIGTHNKNRFFAREVGMDGLSIDLATMLDARGCEARVAEILERLGDAGRRTAMREEFGKQREVAENFNRRLIALLD